MGRSLDDLTIRDKCREAQRVIRELIDHLDQAFLPKVKNLRKLARAQEPGYNPAAVRDKFFQPEAAMEYGLIDRVIATHDFSKTPVGFRGNGGDGAGGEAPAAAS